jgi:squalene-associated FAD-dependent desaturase
VKVLVFGGGIAGLAAAVELVDRGADVELHEASGILGGKAGSTRDADGDYLDHGMHILSPRYRYFLALLEKVGAAGRILWREPEFVYPRSGGGIDVLRMAKLPPPLHFVVGVLRFAPLGWRDRLSGVLPIARGVLSSRRYRERLDDRRYLEWLEGFGVTPRLIELFVAPAIRGVTFLDVDEVSARTAVEGVRYFALSREAARIAFMDGAHSETIAEPLAAWVRARGGRIELGSELTRLRFERGHVSGAELAGGRVLEADAYVSAIPAHRLCGVLPESSRAHRAFRDLARLEPVPVISVQLWFDRKLTDVETAMMSPGRVFNAFVDLSNVVGELRGRGSVMQLVVAPARDLIHLPEERIERLVLDDLCDLFPQARAARLLKRAVVRTRESFHAAYPGMERYRPDARSPLPNLFLAGEYTRTGVPPSMEAAAASGRRAALAVLGAQAGGP